MGNNHPWLRSALAVLSVPLLAAPSAYGVYTYLEPQSGPWAAGSAALGYEVLYIGVNILALHSERLRAYGRNVALAAVATAVVFNTLAHYRATVPDIAHTTVDAAALGLALITSLPLAGLAYAVSVLLHRLTEVTGHEVDLALREQEADKRDKDLTARAAELGKVMAEHAAAVTQWHAERDKVLTDHGTMMAEQYGKIDAAWQALASRERQIDKASADLASREDALARREAEPISRTEIVTTEYVEVATARLSWAELHQLVDMARQRDGLSMSSLRRLVAKEVEEG